ncbi:MAG: CRISPR-associated helicase Cas3', partial [Desulfobacterales bacterium]
HKTGQCACWIRNTVEDARRTFELLSNEKDIDTSKLFLFHARFTLSDRLAKEDTVIETFGNKSNADNREGRILIATQVVEMSLDLDFDVLLTDLSPIDSIIQRAGRLHRHIRDVAGNLLLEYHAIDQRIPPVLRVLSPEQNNSPKANWYSELFPKATLVYPHVGRLWLTACILDEKRQIKMPDDLRMMIEGVYATPIEELPDVFRETSAKAEAEAMGTGSLGKYNALKYENGYRWDSGQWAEEINVPTRVGDETHTIFLTHIKGGKFVPINEGYSPWDLSSVKVSKKKLKKLSEKKCQQYECDLNILVKNEKRLSAYDVVVPLEQCGENQWISEGENGKGDIVKIVYERTSGLMIGDEIKGD